MKRTVLAVFSALALAFGLGCAPIHGHLHQCQHDHFQGHLEHVHEEPLEGCYDLHRFTKPIDPETAGKDPDVKVGP